MFNLKWLDLQLFAGEGTGDGGGEAATGSNSADAGRQRLLELGVPESKLRKNREYKQLAPQQKPAETQQAEAQAQPQEQPPTADNPTETKTDAPKRMSWDDIKADPEYKQMFDQEVQGIVKSRLKNSKGAEETLSKLTPALEVLARQYNLDPANIDYEALSNAVSNDEAFYEGKALQMGVSVETAKKMDQQERDQARKQREEARTMEEQRIQQHIQRLTQQGEELKKTFPTFDLRTELQNPAFARMTSPNIGISVEDAYYAVHRNEIQAASMQVTAQKTAQKISNAIQAGSRRPEESGTTGQAASVTTFDYRKASPEQRSALKQRIREAAARGEKVYPGR